MPLIVLYSLYHDHYIINIRISNREGLSSETSTQELPHIQDLYVSVSFEVMLLYAFTKAQFCSVCYHGAFFSQLKV